jgi:Rieske Fe-S protein
VVLVLDAKAWLGCDEIGFYAIDALCPDLGCLTQQTAEGFVCPGHGSHFDPNGARLDGPTRHSLRYLYVDLDDQGNLIIIRGKPTSPADRLIA